MTTKDQIAPPAGERVSTRAAPRAPWQAPKLLRLATSAAEISTGTHADAEGLS